VLVRCGANCAKDTRGSLAEREILDKLNGNVDKLNGNVDELTGNALH
jgi:hypothetical protein